MITTDMGWGQFNSGIVYLKKNGIGIYKFGICYKKLNPINLPFNSEIFLT